MERHHPHHPRDGRVLCRPARDAAARAVADVHGDVGPGCKPEFACSRRGVSGWFRRRFRQFLRACDFRRDTGFAQPGPSRSPYRSSPTPPVTVPPGSTPPVAPPPKTSGGPLAVTASASQRASQPGAPVRITLTLDNVSPKKVHLGRFKGRAEITLLRGSTVVATARKRLSMVRDATLKPGRSPAPVDGRENQADAGVLLGAGARDVHREGRGRGLLGHDHPRHRAIIRDGW